MSTSPAHTHPIGADDDDDGASRNEGTWRPDVLGEPWRARTLRLRPDRHGTPVATLVRHRARQTGRRQPTTAVLYLHGFADYFFQAGHGAAWAGRGYHFYALDLRDHGRSIRDGRRPGWSSGIGVHAEEITAAMRIIRATGVRQVVLMGHSTGGLMAALYADRNPALIDAVVLNSPWFDLNRPAPVRRLLRPLVATLGQVAPDLVVSTLGESYGRSVHAEADGEFDYNLDWKPLAAFPVRAGWLASVVRAQRRVRHGLDITAPVLVCTSGASGHPTRPSVEDLAGTDAVLAVEDMTHCAARLGTHVRVHQFGGGRHDLALSVEPVRTEYTQAVLDWADAQFDLPR
ncbi:alpha/beta hydrolase [Pseudactinotalea sp. Z1739]|uniref:alpha/beta hydrolase n=1 Tax=Pseudactinotalea sp. Z1739 TaxID=3413028 RepID=UPI003C7E83C0